MEPVVIIEGLVADLVSSVDYSVSKHWLVTIWSQGPRWIMMEDNDQQSI